MVLKKNWLIRTRDFQILGPVSKDKILELLKNGSLHPNDEVCCGNGYWFFIKEKELVEKYLLGMNLQGFNPISEAQDVLTLNMPDFPPEEAAIAPPPPPSYTEKERRSSSPGVEAKKNNLETGEEAVLPSQEDLEYPSLGDRNPPPSEPPPAKKPPPAIPKGLDAIVVKKEEPSPPPPEDPSEEEDVPIAAERKGRERRSGMGGPVRNDRYLIYVLIIVGLLLIVAFIYREKMIRSLFSGPFTELLMSPAQASSSSDLNVIPSEQKKKI